MESNKTTSRKRSKLVRFITAPFRILNKIYMASVYSCATGIENNGGGFVTTSSVAPQPIQLPRNFSHSSTRSENEDDVRELIRVVSTRITNGENINKVHDLEKLEERGTGTVTGTGTNNMQANEVGIRSRSVGIGKLGKIDEDSPVDFKDGDMKVVSYPRSRTYAAPGRVIAYS